MDKRKCKEPREDGAGDEVEEIIYNNGLQKDHDNLDDEEGRSV